MKSDNSPVLSSSSGKSKKSRARRKSGFAVKAQYLARNLVIESGQLPTQRVLRTLVGGGSTRDIVAAIAAARMYLVELEKSQATTSDADNEVTALRKVIIRLKADNAVLLDQDVAREERVRGLERHLLLEAVRQRDQLVAEARANGSIDRRTLLQPAPRAVITPEFDEQIMEDAFNWKYRRPTGST